MPELTDAALRRKLATRSCAFYASQYLTGPQEPPYNGRFLISEHHEEWSDLINGRDPSGAKDFLCVLAARDHGKSAMFSLAYPLWQVDRNPGWGKNNYGVIFSSKQDQASRILFDILGEVESNPNLSHLLPKSRGRNWGGQVAQFANGHRIYARGYGVRVRGMHPTWVVLDDVLNDSTDLFSEVGRKRNISYFYSAIEPMVVPGGQIVVVGTPMHMQDLYAALSEDERVRFAKYPAIKEDGTAMWPERYSLQALNAIKKGVNIPGVFSREYLCEPVAAGSSLFPSDLFDDPRVMREDVSLPIAPSQYKDLGIDSVHIGVDFALSTNTGQDWTVLFVLGVDEHGNRWIIDIIRRRQLAFQDQLELIKMAARTFRADSIFTESNQGQRIFGEELIRTTDLHIQNVQTGEDKHSAVKGIPYIRYLLEQRKYRVPYADNPRTRETIDVWIEELQNHTFESGRVISAGAHDDTVMALFVAEKSIREGVFSFSTSIEEGDEEAYQEAMGFTTFSDAERAEGVQTLSEALEDISSDPEHGIVLTSEAGGFCKPRTRNLFTEELEAEEAREREEVGGGITASQMRALFGSGGL